SLFRRAIVSRLRRKITKAFMMLGGHHHISLTRAFCETRPGAREIRFWLELRGQLLILSHGNTLHFHHPLVTARNAVQPPVNKHSELGFMPPLHATFPVGDCCG